MFRSISRIHKNQLLAATAAAASASTAVMVSTSSESESTTISNNFNNKLLTFLTSSSFSFSTTTTACDEATAAAISKDKFTSLKITKNELVGQNVHKVTVEFPNPTDSLGMTTAGMLMVQGKKRNAAESDDAAMIARPYTPVSRNDLKGKLELVVKDYPDVGNVSTHICKAPVGSYLNIKGCFTKIVVTPNKWKKVGMIAGGSGLTPCLQVAEELLSHDNDKTEITLLFCNQSPDAIFLKNHIDELVSKSNGRFQVHYAVDKALDGDKWEPTLTGYVTKYMISKYLPGPSTTTTDTMIMVCGPPPMYKAICGPKKFEKGKPPAQGELSGILKDMGYTSESVFKF